MTKDTGITKKEFTPEEKKIVLTGLSEYLADKPLVYDGKPITDEQKETFLQTLVDIAENKK